MSRTTPQRLLALALAPSIFVALAGTAVATEGCNAVGWDEPHGVTGCMLYYPAISWIYEEGIASGDAGTGKFFPERAVNRAEFTKLTLLASGVKEPLPPCATAPFPDVPKTAWFAPYVCEAKEKGIIGGFPDGTFKPEIGINFANGAKILAKTFTIPIDRKDAQFYSTQNIWYRPYTAALLRKGAVAETVGGFDKTLTRGEMAEMLYRLKTGKSSINKAQPPKNSELSPNDEGMGYELHILEFGLGLYLSAEPDPPFIFTPGTQVLWLPSKRSETVQGFAFSHVLQAERCGASGLFEHCSATFTDWSVGLYTSTSSPERLLQGLFDPEHRVTRYFGGKPGTCERQGIEGEYTEICIVPWKKEKTLIVIYNYIDTSFAYTDFPGITPTSVSDAMYARIRKAIQFVE